MLLNPLPLGISINLSWGWHGHFLELHIDKATKTCGDKQLYLIIMHFTKQTLNLNYILLMLNVTSGTIIKLVKTEKAILFLNLNSRCTLPT